jgi:hypothetical protein
MPAERLAAARAAMETMSYFRMRSFTDDQIDALARAYATAEPFPHVVIPDLLSVAPADVPATFPALDAACWRELVDGYQHGKKILSKIELVPEPFASMLRELMEPTALAFVERITGIRCLLTDPYLQGAGLHCSGPGGVMAPHSDTHVYERLGIYRRVNLILYLNPEWHESYGGCLELYGQADRVKPVRSIVPAWGTAVIFVSGVRSMHGFMRPVVGAGRIRQSLAVYYYTAAAAPTFGGGHLTHWWWPDEAASGHHQGGMLRRVRLRVHRALRFGSKAFAYLAYRAEPRELK